MLMSDGIMQETTRSAARSNPSSGGSVTAGTSAANSTKRAKKIRSCTRRNDLRFRRPENLRRVEKTGLSTPYSFRSEEHTSELQSLMRISYADFCLNKKNSQNVYTTNIRINL